MFIKKKKMPNQTENKYCGILDQKFCFLVGLFDFVINIFLILYLYILHDVGNGIALFIFITIDIFVILLMLIGLRKRETNMILPYILVKYVIILSSIGANLFFIFLIIFVNIEANIFFIIILEIINIIVFILNIIPLLIVRSYYRKLMTFENENILMDL